MKKKIIIITNGTLPVPAIFGGAAENLTQVLLEYNEVFKDFDFSVFSIGKKLLTLNEISNFKKTSFFLLDEQNFFFKLKKIIRFAVNRKFINLIPNQFLSSVLSYKEELKSADLILISNNPYYAKHLKKTVNCPIYLHLHNNYINENEPQEKIQLLNDFKKVIGVSNFIKYEIQKVTPKDCKVTAVYNGIDLNRFSLVDNQIENSLKKKYNLKEEDLIFIYSGRMQESKGIIFILEAFIKLFQKHKNIKLLFVGGSKYYNSKTSNTTNILKASVAKYSLSKNVFFTGFIDYKLINHYYNIANVAVLPSIETEAFGLTSIEAQAAGLPVIVSDAGGMPETVNKNCGFIVKRKEDITKQLTHFMEVFIKDQPLRVKMAQEALINSKKFSNAIFYEQIKQQLKEL